MWENLFIHSNTIPILAIYLIASLYTAIQRMYEGQIAKKKKIIPY